MVLQTLHTAIPSLKGRPRDIFLKECRRSLQPQSSDRRLPIYALLGVPEVWRYDGYSLEFLGLENGEYKPIEKSLAFPDLPAAIVVEYVQQRLALGESATLREFRKWVRNRVV